MDVARGSLNLHQPFELDAGVLQGDAASAGGLLEAAGSDMRVVRTRATHVVVRWQSPTPIERLRPLQLLRRVSMLTPAFSRRQ
jgi:hypothetical protein